MISTSSLNLVSSTGKSLASKITSSALRDALIQISTFIFFAKSLRRSRSFFSAFWKLYPSMMIVSALKLPGPIIASRLARI